MLFGSRSEKTRYLIQMDQMSLFHSTAVPERAEEKKETTVVKEHTSIPVIRKSRQLKKEEPRGKLEVHLSG